MKREKYIIPKCTNKSVLDIGYVGTKGGVSDLHKVIKKVAKYVVGYDVLAPEDYNGTFIVDDVENLSRHFTYYTTHPNDTFDVIVAADIIEHLFNAGLFLDELKKISGEHTIIIIATPNVMSLKYWTSAIINKYEKCRDDHTCWYSMRTLKQLLTMKGFVILNETYGTEGEINGIRPLIRYFIGLIIPKMRYKLMITFKIK